MKYPTVPSAITSRPSGEEKGTLHYITCHLADAFIQSDLQ